VEDLGQQIRESAEPLFDAGMGAALRFAELRIVPERFPVKSRLHGGWKGAAFNTLFVGTFNALPRALVRPFGWHLMAFCRKQGRQPDQRA
jgi:hypothetical protein